MRKAASQISGEAMKGLTLRPATMADADMLLLWRNDSESRSQSNYTKKIGRKGHLAWLKGILDDPASHRLYIAEWYSQPIGSGRLDFPAPDGDSVEISLTMAPQARGQGLASPIIRLLYEQAKALGAGEVVAQVKPDNVRSLRAFLRADFIPRGEGNVWLRRGII